MIQLSIVIPIYKVEKYIENCLNSIISQTKDRSDVEVILIDDGSPDRCVDIIFELIKDQSNIYLFRQCNMGLSMARNNGLDKAKGEYVWFIDSDDSIVENSIEGILKCLSKDSPDLLQLSYQETYENGKTPIPYCTKTTNIVSGKEVIKNGNLPTPAQFTIYRRHFLIDNSLRFFPDILHEDVEFKPRATYLAKTIAFYPPIVYNYLQRESGSIMNSFKYKNAHDLFIGLNHLWVFLHNVVEKEYKPGFRRLIATYYNNILTGYSKLNEEDQQKVLNLINVNKYIYKELLLSKRIKYILEASLLKISPNIILKFYS